MKNIGIIGMGNLGTHLTKLFCRNNLEHFLTISDKNQDKSKAISDQYDLDYGDNKTNIEISEILFLTVKPDQIKNVCDEINKFDIHNVSFREPKTIVSAAAGVPIKKIDSWLNGKNNIVRFMPNIAVSTGNGSIAWYTNNNTYGVKKELLNCITEGPTNIWLDNENLIDAATVVSGCTPAYIAKFFECYVNVGTGMGFTENQVRDLMKGVFSGTAALLQNETGYKIMKEVASKGGATEKGLEKLTKDGFDKIIKNSAFSSLDRIRKITRNLE